MKHSEKDRLEVAEIMAKDFLGVHRACSYKEMSDIERDNLERIAALARQIIDDPMDYDKNEDVSGLGC